jgi:hypothetical protein
MSKHKVKLMAVAFGRWPLSGRAAAEPGVSSPIPMQWATHWSGWPTL